MRTHELKVFGLIVLDLGSDDEAAIIFYFGNMFDDAFIISFVLYTLYLINLDLLYFLILKIPIAEIFLVFGEVNYFLVRPKTILGVLG